MEFVYVMVYKPVSVSEEEGRGLTLVWGIWGLVCSMDESP